jgi:glycosyltransferase involved in cell wall biosynthesis
MSEKKLVSVIMPAYNCENFIKIAIESILNQSYTNIELLIADDASTDNTKIIIDSYKDSRIKRHHNKTNLGYLKTSNILFKICKGEYITFQDADDFSELNRISKLYMFLENNPNISCVGSNIRKINDKNEISFTSNVPCNHSIINYKFLNFHTVFTGSALMLRKPVIDKIGTYNIYFNRLGSEDIYWFSFIIQNFQVANIEDSLYNYRINPNSVSNNYPNEKSKVLHQLIILMHNRRLEKKEDFIYTNNFKKADACVEALLGIKQLQTSIIKGSKRLFICFLFNPFLIRFFFISYLRNIKQILS